MKPASPDEILEAVRAKVLALTGENRSQTAGKDEIGDDERLTGGSLLDSASAIDLILWAEETFLNKGEELDMTAANFGSINQIAATILAAQKRKKALAA